jgi:hypothetical protein
MPPKASKAAKQQNLAIARPVAMAAKDQNNLEQSLDDLKGKYKDALQQVKDLNELLMEERNKVADLDTALKKEKQNVLELEERWKKEKRRSEGFYLELCVARRSVQRSKKKKETLQGQIDILKLAAFESSKKHKDALSSAKHAVDSLIRFEKENAGLRSDLSLCLARSITQAKSSHELKEVKKELSKCKKQVYRLKGHCQIAALKTERAVVKAKEAVLKQRSVHKLMKKGVYTEDTRNLIRLLTKAGCSAGYIGEVIIAVLKTAGITAIGSPSRRTVSRALVEGFVASQVQLGLEMSNAKCQFLIN